MNPPQEQPPSSPEGGLARKFRRYAGGPGPIPGSRVDCCIYGAAQPVVAARLILGHKDLVKAAMVPALAFALLCGLLSIDDSREDGTLGVARQFYLALVAAAPISPILFTRSYARLAAKAQLRAGFPSREPYIRGYGQAAWETLLQLVIILAGLAPIHALMTLLPTVAPVVIALTSAAWALHWIFVEALDSSRMRPPEGHQEREETPPVVDPPWYQRACEIRGPAPFSWLFAPLRWWGSLLARMTRRWRQEVSVAETHPYLAVGFAVGAAVVLALPGINLFFRPVVVVAAALLLAELDGQLEPSAPSESLPPKNARIVGSSS